MNGRTGGSDALVRVLIVDADPRIRRGLRALLESQPDMAVVGEAATGPEALERTMELHPSLVLLDLSLPTVREGLATVRVLATRKQPCVAASWQPNLREAAIKIGARDFVEKGSSAESLLAAVRGSHAAADLRRQRPTVLNK